MTYGWLDFLGFECLGWILCNVMTWGSGFKVWAYHGVFRNVIAAKWYLTKMDPNGRSAFLAHLTQSWYSFFNPKLPLCKGIYCWQDCRVADTLTHCWWECKLVQYLWSQVGSIFLNCKHTHFWIQNLSEGHTSMCLKRPTKKVVQCNVVCQSKTLETTYIPLTWVLVKQSGLSIFFL